jgi:hypothetical protein
MLSPFALRLLTFEPHPLFRPLIHRQNRKGRDSGLNPKIKGSLAPIAKALPNFTGKV